MSNHLPFPSHAISLEEAKAYLAALDLSYLIEDMTGDNYPLPRWTLEDATLALPIYKNFLYLQKKYFSYPLVPTKEIDEFWHNHILYTKNYHKDCSHIFGHYLHHQPIAKNTDLSFLLNAFEKTKELYLAEFQSPLHIMRLSKCE